MRDRFLVLSVLLALACPAGAWPTRLAQSSAQRGPCRVRTAAHPPVPPVPGCGIRSARGLVGGTLCPLALAPVELRLERTGDPAPGLPFRLSLTATAAAACPDTTLEIAIPAGATLISGETRWSGPLGEGESRTLVVDVSVSDNARRRFEGAVEVRSGTSVLPRTAIHDVGAVPSAPSIQAAPIEETPDGVRIMVLPAREVSP